jgi:hypothetical protein
VVNEAVAEVMAEERLARRRVARGEV